MTRLYVVYMAAGNGLFRNMEIGSYALYINVKLPLSPKAIECIQNEIAQDKHLKNVVIINYLELGSDKIEQ